VAAEGEGGRGRTALLAACGAVAISCVVFAVHPVTANDTFWHLTCGNEFLRTGRVPRTDEFTFTNPGAPWVNHEYLAGAIFAVAERIGGIPGVTVIATLAVAATAFLLCAAAALGPPASIRLFPLVLVPALFGALPRLIPRPHVFSLALTAFLLLVLRRVERGRRRLLWLLPPVVWVWAQLHGGFLVGMVFLGLVAVRLLQEPETRTAACLLALTPILLLVGPYGIETFTFPLRLLRSPTFMSRISEWQPLLGGSPLAQPFCHYAGMLFVGAGIGSSLWLWRRGKTAATETLFLVLLALLALKMRRALAYPVLLGAVPVTHACACALRRRPVPAWLSLLVLPLLGVLALGGIPVGAGQYQPVRFGLGANIPRAAVSRLEELNVAGKCYNSYSFGAYITYRLWPRLKTAIDSRNLVYSEAFFTAYHRSLRHDTPLRRELLDGTDVALFAAPALPDATPPVLAALCDDPRWHLIYFDDTALLFLEEEPYRPRQERAPAYARLRPDLLGFRATTAAQWSEALEEARRAAEEAPASSTAWVLRGRAAFQLAAFRVEEQERLLLESRFSFLRALALPDVAPPHDTYYFLARAEMRLGDTTTAARYLDRCLTRAPDYTPARELRDELAF
jgi:hypothetical protein